MSHAQAAAADRLPWLEDEALPAPRRRRPSWAAPAAAAAIALVAALSYFLGVNSWYQQRFEHPAAAPAATVQLPEPRAPQLSQATPSQQVEVSPQPLVRIERVPVIEPMVAPPIPVIDSEPVSTEELAHADQPAPAAAATPPLQSAPAVPPQVWPVRVIDGASGRLVRIGAFATAHQAKKGWWAIVRLNPALQRLPALVVPVQSLRNGRVYYRLQMGTTSQAHSEVLCQRMRMIGQGCVVVGVGTAE
jgi:hypothetical protein